MIYVIPSIKSYYNNQFEISIDLKLINFLNKFYKKKVKVITEISKIDKSCKLLVISGGNTLHKISKKKEDLIRFNFDNFYFKEALDKNIPILGICHGAQFIGSFFNSKVQLIKNHIGKHYIVYKNKKYMVNSYHNYGITKLGKKLKQTTQTSDKTIESFSYTSKKIIGIMWHPERNSSIKKLDKLILKK